MKKAREKIQPFLKSNRRLLVDPNEEWPEKICRALKWIHDHRYDAQLSVRWMKEQCRLNGPNFSGRFEYYVGKHPKQYWLEHRVAVAKQLLTEDRLAEVSILKIALNLGFRQHSAFSMIFKKYVGCSPSEYRQNHSD